MFAGALAALALPLLVPTAVKAQSYAALKAQITRYGCHLPQYATSVAACRDLHARARAARSSSASSARRQPYPAASTRRTPYPAYTARRPAPKPRYESSGGLFSSLFGPPSADRYSRRRPGNSDRSYYYSSAPTGYGAYRTLCVRLCDGFYFPISYRASYGQIRKDAAQCESSCGVPAKLFYHYNPGGSVEGMVDLKGNRYADLENAFRYREEYVSSCRCTPEPWSEAAKEEYKRRAEIEANPQLAEQEEKDAAPVTAEATPEPVAQPYPQPVRRQTQRRRRGWDSILPFGRWSSGG